MGAVFSSALITGRFGGVWLSGLVEIVGGVVWVGFSSNPAGMPSFSCQ